MMRTIEFYRTISGTCPVQDFLDDLSDKETEKVLWVLKIIREMDRVPSSYFKKLVNTNDIWEVRIGFAGTIIRILGFLKGNSFVVLTNGFFKKSQETPKPEIQLAENRKKELLNRR